jgi:hypothetical protein
MKERIKSILSNLKNVQEDLLALSDDLWLEIDHNYNEAIDNGVQFKSEFNENNRRFSDAANSLSTLIQNHTNTPLYQQEEGQYRQVSSVENERIIKELNNKEPHNLTEDFKYKRPYGFVLSGIPYKNKVTWSELYIQLCTHLLNTDQKIFNTLESNQDHISNRNNKYFSSNSSELRSSQKCGSSTYVEMNLSANGIRDSIKRLLKTYNIKANDLSIYLREDRDAERA